MADPFSIVVGTAGLADVCIRLTKLLKQAKDGFQTLDEELEDLSKEITGLRAVNDSVQRIYEASSIAASDPDDQQVLVHQWQATKTTLAGCQRVVKELDALLVSVLDVGRRKHVKIVKLRKWLKQQSKEEAFNTLRRKLNAHQIALQTSLAAVNV